jgi:hypothetical protein
MGACTLDFCNGPACHGVMKADLRIVVKDGRRHKTLRIALVRVPFVPRQFFVRMNGARWSAFIGLRPDEPSSGRPVSLTRVLTGLRKSLVRAF